LSLSKFKIKNSPTMKRTYISPLIGTDELAADDPLASGSVQSADFGIGCGGIDTGISQDPASRVLDKKLLNSNP
jgi:hypothetical protein